MKIGGKGDWGELIELIFEHCIGVFLTFFDDANSESGLN